MKNILGLDLGTNSIGWAVVNGSVNDNGSEQLVKIQASGSRIIPMDAAMIGDFNKGNSNCRKNQIAWNSSFKRTISAS